MGACHSWSFSLHMNDTAILAARQALKEQQARLLREADDVKIELKQLPLTSTEQEEREAKKQREAIKHQEFELREKRHCVCITFGCAFFVTCTIIGIAIYLTAGVLVMNNDKACGMAGPLFSHNYPERCESGVFTAGIVFVVIGISPILCVCLYAVGQGGGGGC